MLVKVFIALFFAISSASCKEVCYGDLGCFSNAYPFSGVLARPIALLPESPEKISTFFTLYSRKLSQGELISAANLTQTSFNPFLKTKFITHGFLDNAMLPWIIEMKEAILQAEDVNVITVDWKKGYRSLSFINRKNILKEKFLCLMFKATVFPILKLQRTLELWAPK